MFGRQSTLGLGGLVFKGGGFAFTVIGLMLNGQISVPKK
jgi:hypothetical protein